MWLFVLLSAVAALSAGQRDWQCPEAGIGICIEECSVDTDCRGNSEKCCSNGCGHVCTHQSHIGPDCRLVRCAAPPCVNPIWIPGICCPLCLGHGDADDKCRYVRCEPPPCELDKTVILPGHCCPLCIEEGQCLFGSSGICGTILGLVCDDNAECKFLNPNISDAGGVCCDKVKESGKKGRCPRDLDYRYCRNECKTDYDCRGTAKCCFNGCASVCVKPKNFCCNEGKRVNSGESFPHPDGCNTCFCNDGVVACTKIFCFCCFRGQRVNSGEDFPHPDGCNTCYCDDGTIICTLIDCSPPVVI